MNTTPTLQETARQYVADRRRGHQFDRRREADRRSAVRALTSARDRRERDRRA